MSQRWAAVPVRHLGIAILLFCWPLSVAWVNPYRDDVAEANQLLKSGKYKEAIGKYGEQLVDNPESPLLNYNMGNANYRAGKFSDALASYTRVRTAEDDPKRTARTAYNAGNAQYRLAAGLEKDKPQDALKGYAQALVAYRRAIGADASDQDAKFNYELTVKKIEDLQKKLQEEQDKKKEQEKKQPQDQKQQDQQQQEQQQSQQDQQKDQQQQQQQQQDEQDTNQNQQSKDQEQQQQQTNDQQQEPQQGQDQQQPSQEQQQQQQAEPSDEQSEQASETQQGEEGTAGETSKDTARHEAAALLDSAKNEELRPDEFARRVQGRGVAEPAQDW